MTYIDAQPEPQPSMHHQPVTFEHRRLGIRELCLLLIAAGFTMLMLDLGNVALLAGLAVFALWTVAMVRGPRPGAVLTIVYGAGLFVTCFWWPREGWWPIAIALTWIGLALIAGGVVTLLAGRLRVSGRD